MVAATRSRLKRGAPSSSEVWCICRRPYAAPMLECSGCRNWFHLSCMGVEIEKVRVRVLFSMNRVRRLLQMSKKEQRGWYCDACRGRVAK